jgi:hypothetical protein
MNEDIKTKSLIPRGDGVFDDILVSAKALLDFGVHAAES